jgi:hypothetical protein
VEKVTFLSEINNLPTMELVEPISNVLKSMVPIFNKLLEKLVRDNIIMLKNEKIRLEDCQMIVKAQQINLKTSHMNGVHAEGGWHLEGTSEEKIIASGIYYYDSKNVAPTDLNFRIRIREPSAEWFEENGKDSVNNTHELGYITTGKDLAIVFPNMLQHKVSKIELTGRQKKNGGHRSILVFWLVHPDHRIVSTRDVYPLQGKILPNEASVYREMLMYERRNKNRERIYEYTPPNDDDYSLCEH